MGIYNFLTNPKKILQELWRIRKTASSISKSGKAVSTVSIKITNKATQSSKV